jgi:hypothetical protein
MKDCQNVFFHFEGPQESVAQVTTQHLLLAFGPVIEPVWQVARTSSSASRVTSSIFGSTHGFLSRIMLSQPSSPLPTEDSGCFASDDTYSASIIGSSCGLSTGIHGQTERLHPQVRRLAACG